MAITWRATLIDSSLGVLGLDLRSAAIWAAVSSSLPLFSSSVSCFFRAAISADCFTALVFGFGFLLSLEASSPFSCFLLYLLD